MNNIIQTIAKFLATQLYKLEIQNPIVFIIVQSFLLTASGLLLTDKFVIPTPAFLSFVNLDELVTGLVIALVALVGPNTKNLNSSN